jgi:hypothetical protein
VPQLPWHLVALTGAVAIADLVGPTIGVCLVAAVTVGEVGGDVIALERKRATTRS